MFLSDNRYEWIMTDSALLAIGAINIPRGTDTPTSELEYIMTHSGAKHIILENSKTLEYHKDYHYKPVWDGTDENLREIEEFRVDMDIPKDKTYIMPAGDTRKTLIEMYPKVFEMCAERGYNMTGRDHIIAFDQQRMV